MVVCGDGVEMVLVISQLMCSSDVLGLLPMPSTYPWAGLSLLCGAGVWDWGLTPGGEGDEANNPCQGTTCREHRYSSESAWGGLSRKQGGAQQGPALSERCLLSLLAVLFAPGLLSVTSLLRNSRRQAEMGAPVPGPCWSALFRKWGGIWLAITVPLAWQA